MKTSITHLRIGTLAEPHVHYAGKDERAIAALEHQVIEWCSGAAALPKGSTMTPGAFKHEERAAGMSISPCNSCVSWLSHTALYFAFAVLVMPRMRGGLTPSQLPKKDEMEASRDGPGTAVCILTARGASQGTCTPYNDRSGPKKPSVVEMIGVSMTKKRQK